MKAVEPTGSETFISVMVEDKEILVATMERVALNFGDMIHLSAEPDRIHIFDAVTEKAL